MRFGEKLRQLREEKGLTRQQLADLCGPGVSLRAITQWELGEREPLWTAVQTLARALGVECQDLKDDLPEPPPSAAPSDDQDDTPKKKPARKKKP